MNKYEKLRIDIAKKLCDIRIKENDDDITYIEWNKLHDEGKQAYYEEADEIIKIILKHNLEKDHCAHIWNAEKKKVIRWCEDCGKDLGDILMEDHLVLCGVIIND